MIRNLFVRHEDSVQIPLAQISDKLIFSSGWFSAVNCQWQQQHQHHHGQFQTDAHKMRFIFINLFWFGLDFFSPLILAKCMNRTPMVSMTIQQFQLIETTRFMRPLFGHWCGYSFVDCLWKNKYSNINFELITLQSIAHSMNEESIHSNWWLIFTTSQ